MDADSVESHYPTVMASIAYRISASDNLLSLMKESPNDQENWIRLDAVALQVRKICELILLGSTLAHLQEGSNLDLKKWHPKDVFKEIERFNNFPLPLPLAPELRVLAGRKQFIPASKPMPFDTLSSLYGQCANILHVPSASRVLEEKVVPFDWHKFRRWVDGFTRLLKGHLLLLPELKRVLVCTWTGKVGDVPNSFLLGGDGEAVLNVDSLNDFALIVP